MREDVTYKWNWNNGSEFAHWMTAQVTHKVLSEFWCWYDDVAKTISRMADDEQEFEVLEQVGEKPFEALPLPSLDAKFTICGKEFEVRDALFLATLTVVDVAKDLPDSPDGWKSPEVECLNGVRAFALGFFCGVVRGMLD